GHSTCVPIEKEQCTRRDCRILNTEMYSDSRSERPQPAFNEHDFQHLPWPQPSHRASSETSVNETIHRRFHRRQPRSPIPNRHLPESDGVADKGGGAGEAKDLEILRVRCEGT